MKVGLFIPCYVNHLMPEVAISTLDLLKSLNLDVDYPLCQTCCAQPLIHSGETKDSKELAIKFFNIFKDYDYIVAPSASCIYNIHHDYHKFLSKEDYNLISTKSFELVEFLVDILNLKKLPNEVSFPVNASLHYSCQGLRGLKLSMCSERNLPFYSKPKELLSLVKGINLVDIERSDECCGFGGTFSIDEPHISMAMGKAKINDHQEASSKYIIGYDPSCLMHLQGIIEAKNIKGIKTIYIADVLLGRF